MRRGLQVSLLHQVGEDFCTLVSVLAAQGTLHYTLVTELGFLLMLPGKSRPTGESQQLSAYTCQSWRVILILMCAAGQCCPQDVCVQHHAHGRCQA